MNRRDFFQAGAAAGAGVAAFGAGAASPSSAAAHEEEAWDYEADIVVLGSGCTGLPAAIRASDLGASVLVIDQNFDVGGRMMHSGSWLSLGGGDPVQVRDANGESDDEGFITVDPLVPTEALEDDIELLFKDVTDWSVLEYTRTKMPIRNPGQLSDQEYADVIAYMLSYGGAPAGDTKLEPDIEALSDILIEPEPTEPEAN